MWKSKFTKTQIATLLHEAERGIPLADLLRKHGVSKSTFFKWRSRRRVMVAPTKGERGSGGRRRVGESLKNWMRKGRA